MFSVFCGLCLCNLLIGTNNFRAWCCSSIMLSFWAAGAALTETLTQDSFSGFWPMFWNLLLETNNFGLVSVLLLCLVSELQELPWPGLELRTVFRSCDLYKMSSWSQRINTPSLVRIGSYIPERVSWHAYTHTCQQFNFLYKIMTINSVSWCTFREWQMYRAFQTAMGIHKPDVVFVLGEFLMKFGNLKHIIPGVLCL
jgi:hypothetical protein